MESLFTPSNITFGIGIIGVIFTVYHYFKKPQIDAEKIDALTGQQLKYMQESTDRRFCEIHEEIKSVLAMSQNHIHTVDTKVEALTKDVRNLGLDVAKLGTIIEERIPRKF